MVTVAFVLTGAGLCEQAARGAAEDAVRPAEQDGDAAGPAADVPGG